MVQAGEHADTSEILVQIKMPVSRERNLPAFFVYRKEQLWVEEEAHLEKRVEDPDKLTARSHPLINKSEKYGHLEWTRQSVDYSRSRFSVTGLKSIMISKAFQYGSLRQESFLCNGWQRSEFW